MPSPHMTRYPVDLYPDQDAEVRKLIRQTKVKRCRFLRECVKYVLASDSRTKAVINKAKTKNYISRNR